MCPDPRSDGRPAGGRRRRRRPPPDLAVVRPPPPAAAPRESGQEVQDTERQRRNISGLSSCATAPALQPDYPQGRCCTELGLLSSQASATTSSATSSRTGSCVLKTTVVSD